MTTKQLQHHIHHRFGRLATHYPRLVRWLAERLSTDHFRGLPLTVLAGLLVVNVMVLSEIAENLVNAEPMVQVDQEFTHWLFQGRSMLVSQLLYALTWLGSAYVTIGLTLLGSYVLYRQKKVRNIVTLWILMAGVGLFVLVGKRTFIRARPVDVAYYDETGYSFPSGHSAMAMTLYGLLGYWLVRGRRADFSGWLQPNLSGRSLFKRCIGRLSTRCLLADCGYCTHRMAANKPCSQRSLTCRFSLISIFMFLLSLLLVGCALLAFSLSAVCGGGAGLLLLPILGSLLPSAQVPAALSIGTVSSSISRIIAFWSRIRWDVVVWFVPPALPAVWVGAKLLTYINPLYLELLMGLFLMANLPLIFRSTKELEEIHPLPKGYLALIGLAAGFVSGLTGAVGLLFNRFYLRYGMAKEEIVATRAANEIMLHGVKLALYASFGLLTGKALTLGATIAVAAMISSWGMKWVLPRLSESLFRRVGYTAMVVSGLSLFTEAAGKVVTKEPIDINYSPFASGMSTQLQWRNKLFSLEFEYDEGFEFEHSISFNELPPDKQVKAKVLSQEADKVVLEEVFGIDKHSYEVYVYRKGKLEKFDI